MLPKLTELFGAEAAGVVGSGAEFLPLLSTGRRKQNRRGRLQDPDFKSRASSLHNLRRRLHPRAAKVASHDAADLSSDSSDAPSQRSSGTVADILLECYDDDAKQTVLLVEFDGVKSGVYHWVRQSGLGKGTAAWWRLERENRYPGYTTGDLCLTDSRTFLTHIAQCHVPLLTSIGLNVQEPLMARARLQALKNGVVSLSAAVFSAITAPIVPIPVPMHAPGPGDEKAALDGPQLHEHAGDMHAPVHRDVKAALDGPHLHEHDDGSGLDHKHVNNAAGLPEPSAEQPSPEQKKRPLRLLLDDSVSDASDGLRFRGQKAYCVRGIRDERIVHRQKEYLVAWEDYSSSEATWEPALNVNREAVSNWKQRNS